MIRRGTVLRAAYDAAHERWCGPDCPPSCQEWQPDLDELQAIIRAVRVFDGTNVAAESVARLAAERDAAHATLAQVRAATATKHDSIGDVEFAHDEIVRIVDGADTPAGEWWVEVVGWGGQQDAAGDGPEPEWPPVTPGHTAIARRMVEVERRERTFHEDGA